MEAASRVCGMQWGTGSSKLSQCMLELLLLTWKSFWSYEWMKQTSTSQNDSDRDTAVKIMLCGGLAGIM
jgi:hypothetical protein